ncbi:MAG: relaxase/mobilization nuclease domain-containing protein, partial [Candidatus Dormibacteria bacterium]
MIANRGRARLIGPGSFGDAVAYITRAGEHAQRHEPALAVWSDGVTSIDTAALEMSAVAAASRARRDPLYHLIVSWAPGEEPTAEQARAATREQLKALGFAGHQYVAALQNDGDGGLHHVHVVVNRVSPVTYRSHAPQQDFETMRDTCRAIELAQGWQYLGGREGPRVGRGARDAEYWQRRRCWERRMR